MTKGQQGQGNCAYVRKLLQQKQPEFSAVLEFAVREVSIQLACGGSVDTAAKTLFCQPNTVRYRLNPVAEHTGRSLTDPRAVTELILALQADYLGRAA